MQLAGLKFNLVNVWALPLIIGSATEYGVNIVLRSLELPAHGGGPRLARSIMGVGFNGLTTLAVSLVVLPTLVRLAHERGRLPVADWDPAARSPSRGSRAS